MGLFNKLKNVGKEIGIGLDSNEQYNRAYQKGVLLQPPNYSDASKHFTSAAEKFQKDNNTEMAQRANANAILYELVSSGNIALLPNLTKALEPISEIERLGSQVEMVSTEPLMIELTALNLEAQADSVENHEEKANHYREASTVLYKLGGASLMLTDKLNVPGPTDKAMNRAAFCEAFADYNDALSVVMESPAAAEDSLNKAKISFQQASIPDWVEKVDAYMQQLHANRYCWMCNRKMQGEDIFYHYYPAKVEKYHANMLGELDQDKGMVEKPGHVTLCTVCGSSIENQADRYATERATEVHDWAEEIFENHNERINELVEAINNLNKDAHRH